MKILHCRILMIIKPETNKTGINYLKLNHIYVSILIYQFIQLYDNYFLNTHHQQHIVNMTSIPQPKQIETYISFRADFARPACTRGSKIIFNIHKKKTTKQHWRMYINSETTLMQERVVSLNQYHIMITWGHNNFRK